jgi:hypothetical protein
MFFGSSDLRILVFGIEVFGIEADPSHERSEGAEHPKCHERQR